MSKLQPGPLPDPGKAELRIYLLAKTLQMNSDLSQRFSNFGIY
jgi:hypothetical protein